MLLVALAAAPAAPQAAVADSPDQQALVEEQRRVFREVYPRAELGDWRPAAKHAALLRQYVLWPDLRAAWLRTRVRNNDYAEIDTFLSRFGTLKPARELRYRYALELGASGDFKRYLQIYQQFYQELGLARLDCLGLQAKIAMRQESSVTIAGLEKWLVGTSQVDECDPVFDSLRNRGLLGADQYRTRFELAIEARQFGLARYLARSLSADYQSRARQWTAVLEHPETFLSNHDTSKDTADYRRQLLYAAERLAYKRPQLTATLWQEIALHYPFSEVQGGTILRHIALWAARRGHPGAHSMLKAVPADAIDTEVHRWLARKSLQASNWPGVVSAINAMPPDEQLADQWRYWLARASQHTGNPILADTLFAALASERSFYGFLAADQTKQEYLFADRRLVPDDAIIEELSQLKSLVRAHELLLVGLDGRGRSEWDTAVAMLTNEQRKQAAILAHRWGWHSRAIAMTASIGLYDDLEVRYPLPFGNIFKKYSNTTNLQQSWVLGLARSESLFMRDIRSGAGAIGLMQLLPETGRRTARDFNLPYVGYLTLIDPEGNVRLGTAYLKKLLARFDNNQVLATAAYNAGPLSVDAWLPELDTVDSLIWIENIPYNETRKYVRRVLAADTIFHWRLTGNTKRLSQKLTAVRALTNKQNAMPGENE